MLNYGWNMFKFADGLGIKQKKKNGNFLHKFQFNTFEWVHLKKGKLYPFLYVADAKLSEFLQIFRHLACHETILPIDIGHEIHEKKRKKMFRSFIFWSIITSVRRVIGFLLWGFKSRYILRCFAKIELNSRVLFIAIFRGPQNVP